ncbi:MAG: hypothetical protein WBD36_09950 [Bacteroidota bacterium]
MKPWFRKIAALVLLAGYSSAGIGGHLQVLNHFLLSRSLPAISKAKSTGPKDARPFWTQQRHIPTTFRVVVPQPAIVETPRTTAPDIRWFVAASSDVPPSTPALTFGEPTRAPPLS